MIEVPDKITCVDCGEDAFRMGEPPEDGWQAGDIVSFRCRGCLDRWDFELEDSEENPGEGNGSQ